MNTHKVTQVWLYFFLHLNARWRMGGQRHAPFALAPGKRAGTHFTGGWVGSIDGLDV